jgi:glycosyltransferase involved in cell wall biosynthesis
MPHILERSAAVVAVSESTKQDIVASFGINPDKIHVIYNGYDELRFCIIEDSRPILDRYGLQSGKYFLFVGSILKHKNLSRLVQAFARLEGEPILVIAGVCKDVDCLEDVKKVATNLGIFESRLRYLEYVEDDALPYLYNGALAFILPSLHEGFGVPIIESMACGTPVITSNCSAMPEVAGGAALLVDPYSVESIASAMREIIDNPRRTVVLRTAGLERAKMFRWSYSAQKLYDLCRMVSES